MPDPTLFADAGNMVRDALLSDCGRYRWWLTRQWSDEGPWCCWIMLNPSTADASIDDPTIRRCIAFSRSWGCAGMAVVNLFAFRATDPRQLMKASDPVGEHGNVYIDHWARATTGPTVAAWGNWGAMNNRGRNVALMLEVLGHRLHCLGTTKDGHPKHPLARGKHRVPDGFEPVPFTIQEARQ